MLRHKAANSGVVVQAIRPQISARKRKLSAFDMAPSLISRRERKPSLSHRRPATALPVIE